jgi:hypothetical protein
LLLGIALFELPYGYYQLLRIAIFLTGLFHLWQSVERAEQLWAWTFGAITLIYNPIATLSLGRPLWMAVNIATIAVLVGHWLYSIRRSTTRR